MATKRSQYHKYLVTIQKRYHHMYWHFGIGDKVRWRAINKAKDYEISYNWRKWDEQHPELSLANAIQKLRSKPKGGNNGN